MQDSTPWARNDLPYVQARRAGVCDLHNLQGSLSGVQDLCPYMQDWPPYVQDWPPYLQDGLAYDGIRGIRFPFYV